VTSLSDRIFCSYDAKHSRQITRMCVCFIFWERTCAALYAEAYVTILSTHVVDQTWTTTNLVVHEVVARYVFRIRQIPTAALVGLKRNGRSQRFASARYDGSRKNPIEARGSRPVHK